jgi:peptidoglycan hydrolase CwlO-like protein
MRIAAYVAAAAAALAPAAHGDLNSELQGIQSSEAPLRSGIAADERQIGAFQRRIDDVQRHLDGLEAALATQERLLAKDKDALRRSRARLLRLRMLLHKGQVVLARQVRAAYESPAPDLVTVVIESKGFTDLLEQVDKLQAIGRHNAKVVGNVKDLRDGVAREERRLTELTHRQQRVTSAVLVERDAIDETRLDLVRRQAVWLRAKRRKSARLDSLERERVALEKRVAEQQARAAAAIGAGYTGPLTVPGSFGTFVPHGGDYGLFLAPGTNYSAGVEPIIAARLDALGKALHLHLIGLSGYRTPQHSVEVGGFPNDPHTQGRASDTPGVEGVSEATLNRFGLTRPFGGAREADHIQLLGG